MRSQLQTWSGHCPDLIANQRSRDDVSSAAAAVTHPVSLPTNQSASPALDTGGAAPLPPRRASPEIGEQQLLTADDVAAILRVPRSFVYALARRGELPTVRLGDRYVRFRTPALERWIASRETSERVGTQ
jgi:excisionase family DNA binding protein